MPNIAQIYQNLRTSQNFQRRFSLTARLIIALALIFFAIFPVLWIISASFSSTQSLSTQTLIPDRVSLVNYQRLFGLDPTYKFGDLVFQKWIFKSVKIATISTVLSLGITTMAAYAFSRMRFKGRVAMLKAILLIQVFPNLLALVAIYVLIFQFGELIPVIGLNTHAGLIMVYLGGSMGMNIWLMKGYLDTIPRDIDDSGMVDGATHFQIFWNLILPLLRPILVVIGLLSFIGIYGDFVLARILLTDVDKYTLMVGLQIFTAGQFDQKWGVFAAGALLGALPIMTIYLILQDQIVGGLTVGAVKG